ncbi:MAG: response regulator [Myxococcota bacterium]
MNMIETRKPRVLVVDDEPQILVALEDLLANRFSVLKTESPEHALDLMSTSDDIAVLITDQRMPRMTGDALLSRIGPSRLTLKILLTGYADLSAVIRAVNEGRIFAYVTKPWDPDDLRLKVDKAAEHFQIAQELAYERKLLHDLMDNIPDGIYFKDTDLKFRRANRAFAGGLGCSPDDLVGKRLEDVSKAPALLEAARVEESGVLRQGEPVRDVVREYHNGTARRFLSETKAPIRLESGEISGLVGISRDVTERIESQEALRIGEQRFREQSLMLDSILNSMGDAVVAADSSGRFLVYNRQAERLLGPRPKNLRADEWARELPMVVNDRLSKVSANAPGDGDNPLVAAMYGKEIEEIELSLQNDSGTRITVALRATPLIGVGGALLGGIALIRDVTQRRELEQQLRHAQKMEGIGQLAGGVAHDFNNLLAVIKSYGELLLRDLKDDTTKTEDLEQLLHAANRGAALTRQLLTFSRRQVVQPRLLQLNEVVVSIEKMLRRIIGEDIDLVTSLAPDLDLVKADAGQIEQVLLNLAVNARDAMPDGGKLTVETANVHLASGYADSDSNVAEGDYVMVAVSDTGSGMSEEIRKHIFEPFFTTKEVGKGTGLGLSTVYGIVQQSGGHIWVYSELKQGTAFKIYFPRASGSIPARALSKQLPSRAKVDRTILLVEDDDAVRRVASRILRESGYTVLETRHAGEARKICEERGSELALLLTDVVMPGVSGPKLAEELTALLPHLRVLYMSGFPGAAVVHSGALRPGANCIEKPFSPASLVDKIEEVLATRDSN